MIRLLENGIKTEFLQIKGYCRCDIAYNEEWSNAGYMWLIHKLILQDYRYKYMKQVLDWQYVKYVSPS